MEVPKYTFLSNKQVADIFKNNLQNTNWGDVNYRLHYSCGLSVDEWKEYMMEFIDFRERFSQCPPGTLIYPPV